MKGYGTKRIECDIPWMDAADIYENGRPSPSYYSSKSKTRRTQARRARAAGKREIHEQSQSTRGSVD